MDLLIDTQILVWSLDINSPFLKKYKSLLEDTANNIFVSQISLMELAIKKNLNKLPDFVPDIKTVTNQLISNGFEILKLSNEHIFTYQNLPLHQEHRDLFDRFLIAVAIRAKLPVLTADNKFKLYSSLIEILTVM